MSTLAQRPPMPFWNPFSRSNPGSSASSSPEPRKIKEIKEIKGGQNGVQPEAPLEAPSLRRQASEKSRTSIAAFHGFRNHHRRHEKEELRSQVYKAEQRNQDLQSTIDSLSQQLRQKDAEGIQMRQHFTALQNESVRNTGIQDQTRRLLEVRTRELQDVHSLLATQDRVSEVEVMNMVTSLNAEVYHVAALLAEQLHFGSEENIFSQETVNTYTRRVRDFLAPQIDALRTHVCHDDPPFLAQMGIQVFLVMWCETEKKIQETELPAVSAKWRSLTRLHFLIGIGWTPQTNEDGQNIHQVLSNQLRPLLKIFGTLDKAMGDGVTSSDLKVVTVRTGEEFDSEKMVEAYRDKLVKYNSETPGHVVCTTDLGLCSLVRGAGARILLKPKVILDTPWGPENEGQAG